MSLAGSDQPACAMDEFAAYNSKCKSPLQERDLENFCLKVRAPAGVCKYFPKPPRVANLANVGYRQDCCGVASRERRQTAPRPPRRMMPASGHKQQGFLMIVVIFLLVVLFFLGGALSTMLGNSTLASGGHVGSMQAFFLADSGLEVEQRRWAQNLDWYRSTTDPNPTAPVAQALGGGTFTMYANLPATKVRTGFPAAAVTLNVFTTARFPATGILQVDDDMTGGGEFVRYTGVTANSFTGVTRGQTVGTVTAVASNHARGDVVYPVSQLRTVMPANCTPMASINLDTNTKFLSAGLLDIEGEEIAYGGMAIAGGTMTLTGIVRCQGVVINVAHAVGQPVTPILVGGDSAWFQVEIFSTGVKGSNIRYARRTVDR